MSLNAKTNIQTLLDFITSITDASLQQLDETEIEDLKTKIDKKFIIICLK